MAVRLVVTPTNDARGRGSFSATESEQCYTIEAVGGRGTFRTVDGAFRRWLASNAPRDAFGNPVAPNGVEIEEHPESLGRLWTATVRYEQEPADAEAETDAPNELLEYGFRPASFSTTGGTARVTRSFGTTAYPIGGSVLDCGGFIGWNGEGFDGCDVVVPTFSFELEATTPSGFISSFGSFANRVAQQVGTVNAEQFLGFLPGTVLFQGISSGRLQKATTTDGADYAYWTLTYSFAASPHVVLDVGGVSVSKPGWTYFWTLTEKSWNATTGEIEPFLRACYVERVYRSTNFHLLQIGG